MDIKHCINAKAALTLGKSMTFRDYAQGAYRMRGIGNGQTIEVLIIPEIEKCGKRVKWWKFGENRAEILRSPSRQKGKFGEKGPDLGK